ncbi:MAG: nitrate reductase cytochrome c-type subunit [Gammaproteobacteria bacterium]|nr:nitrate reductase cytochrome c-type subunit [Rhodocyclaceae bacterium]MBU3909277.1 nitrate reductase cytochrome c-type subunit [Gammaproteobacteria bacterium]MBU3989529.1 nitrate reductase cytochrome c-type subunit [Gammaproteobacteria bacterium]MBU4005563.1 nitrate reductase cytochrome c-type subunit [Gammaproteobacteria bacterium]MBU4020884.1 nitrate reductase cytochrome c-type subunit [Gammaproteobacteria bacterium]
MIKKILRSLTLVAILGAAAAYAADAPVRVQSLRGDTPISQTPEADMYRQIKDAKPLPRDFVQQPPLIPHTIRDYQITMNFNKCMDCHSWAKTRESGATKVSVTHFKTRDGVELSNISPLRYFCTQCHVSQADAQPLVGNTFRPGVGLQ